MTQSEQRNLTSAVKYVMAIFRWHVWKKKKILFVCFPIYFPPANRAKTASSSQGFTC